MSQSVSQTVCNERRSPNTRGGWPLSRSSPYYLLPDNSWSPTWGMIAIPHVNLLPDQPLIPTDMVNDRYLKGSPMTCCNSWSPQTWLRNDRFPIGQPPACCLTNSWPPHVGNDRYPEGGGHGANLHKLGETTTEKKWQILKKKRGSIFRESYCRCCSMTQFVTV